MKSLGALFLIGVTAILIFIFGPVVKEELRYQFDRWGSVQYSLDANPDFPDTGIRPIVPVDPQFSIVIPKINANAAIIFNIDPNYPQESLIALEDGVAHVKKTQLPDEEGNLFLFAQAADSFWRAGRYNPVFFLAGKLKQGDEISIFYRGRRYRYEVSEKKVIWPAEIEYWKAPSTGKTVTLMTGYPPGTIYKRLIIVAGLVD